MGYYGQQRQFIDQTGSTLLVNDQTDASTDRTEAHDPVADRPHMIGGEQGQQLITLQGRDSIKLPKGITARAVSNTHNDDSGAIAGLRNCGNNAIKNTMALARVVATMNA